MNEERNSNTFNLYPVIGKAALDLPRLGVIARSGD